MGWPVAMRPQGSTAAAIEGAKTVRALLGGGEIFCKCVWWALIGHPFCNARPNGIPELCLSPWMLLGQIAVSSSTERHRSGAAAGRP